MEKHKGIDFDLYEVLGITNYDATEKEIIRAYRKMALKYHPDKNPGNSSAAERFLRISKALEILCDVGARKAYDQLRKAKLLAAERHRKLNDKRKKLKETLEAREFQAKDESVNVSTPGEELLAAERLAQEIERLRKQGSELLRREKEEIARQLREEKAQQERSSCDNVLPRLRLRWKPDDNYNYDEFVLRNIFGKYGEITALVISSKKKNPTAIIEFSSADLAVRAMHNERGYEQNPLDMSWLSGSPPVVIPPPPPVVSNNFSQFKPSECGATVDKDFESIVLMRMRQAEERKRLIAEMEAEKNS